jgi:hypothetical protein
LLATTPMLYVAAEVARICLLPHPWQGSSAQRSSAHLRISPLFPSTHPRSTRFLSQPPVLTFNSTLRLQLSPELTSFCYTTSHNNMKSTLILAGATVVAAQYFPGQPSCAVSYFDPYPLVTVVHTRVSKPLRIPSISSKSGLCS